MSETNTVTMPRAFTPQRDLCQSLIECGHTARKKVTSGVQTVFRHIAAIKEDADQHAHLWKVVPAAMIALSQSNKGLIFSPAARVVVFIEGVQVIGDFADIFSGKMLKEKLDKVARRIAFLFANLGTTLLWIHELKITTLGAKLLGTFSMIANGGAAVGYLIGVGKALHTLATLKDHEFKKEVTIKALLDLIAGVAGAALPIINLIGVTICPVSIAALVLTSSGLGLLSFCYENDHKEELKSQNLEGKGVWSDISAVINNSEGLEKVSKLFLKLVEECSQISIVALAKDAKTFVEFHEILKLPQSIKGLICPDERDGKFIWEKSIWKCGDLIFKTGSGLASSAAFLIKYKLVEWGSLAAATIGGLPLLVVSPLAMTVGFGTCGVIENTTNFIREYLPDNRNKKKAKNARVNVEAKLEKWNDLSMRIKEKNTKPLAVLEVKKSMTKHIGKLSADNAQMFRQMDVNEFAALKLKRLEVRHENACQRCHKYSVSFLNDLGKVAAPGFGLAAMATAGTAAAPVLAAVSGTAAVVGGFVGVFKFVYDKQYFKQKSEPSLAALQKA